MNTDKFVYIMYILRYTFNTIYPFTYSRLLFLCIIYNYTNREPIYVICNNILYHSTYSIINIIKNIFLHILNNYFSLLTIIRYLTLL